jgi:hypothetical protein
MKTLNPYEIVLVAGGQLSSEERFYHDGFLAGAISYPFAVGLAYYTLGGPRARISDFVGLFGIIEGCGIGIGLAASHFYR